MSHTRILSYNRRDCAAVKLAADLNTYTKHSHTVCVIHSNQWMAGVCSILDIARYTVTDVDLLCKGDVAVIVNNVILT